MDSVKTGFRSPQFQLRLGVILIFISLVLVVLVYKNDLQKWLIPVPDIERNGSPVLLVFNRHKGCDCIVQYYEMAANEIQQWADSRSTEINILHIDLDNSPNYGVKFQIRFAPALILLDADGKELIRQEGILNKDQVFDLIAVEEVLDNIR